MSFDPYHQWLGIPPAEQPPHHYRLLGVSLFESNTDVISNAADRQMAHARTYQLGKHAAESQKLLSEIAKARACLLNAAARANYDKKLHATLSQSAAVPVLASANTPAPAAEAGPAAEMASADEKPPSVDHLAKWTSRPMLLGAASAIAVIVIGIALLDSLPEPQDTLPAESTATPIAAKSKGGTQTPTSPEEPVAERSGGDGGSSAVPTKSATPMALQFDGTDWVDVDLKYDGQSPLTIEMWASPVADHVQSIVANCHGVGFDLLINGDGHWEFSVRDQRTYRGAASDEPARLGEWSHVAGTFDGQSVHLFVDGKQQKAVGKLTSRHKVSQFRYMIGADPDYHSRPEKHFQGMIAAVHVLHSIEYAENFAPTKSFAAKASTALLLPLNEGAGNVAQDASAHQRTVTIQGATWVPAGPLPAMARPSD